MAKVTVTGTVTDANSQAYANGTYLFTSLRLRAFQVRTILVAQPSL